MKKIVVAWIVCVLGLVALLCWVGRGQLTKAEGGAQEKALIQSEFNLVKPDGSAVTDKAFRGRYMLVFFGFTHCPDTCPTTLLMVQNALTQLPTAKAAQVQPIFITVDPARDTPKVMGDYAKHFGPQLLGLSGSEAQIRDAAEHYKVYYSKVENKAMPDDYMMDHSSFLYLMGPDGQYITHFPADTAPQALADALAAHVH